MKINYVPYRIAAAMLLVLISPYLIIIWAMIKISNPFLPAFFTQTRIGHEGKPFRIWKMRSMFIIDSIEPVTEPNDPRITKIGSFIRRSHLDEFIQLINVVNGSMRFIGPRSKMPTESKKAMESTSTWARRHRMIPGITGLKQVSGRTSYHHEAVLDRLMMMKYHSPCFRLWIIYKTATRVLGMKGE